MNECNEDDLNDKLERNRISCFIREIAPSILNVCNLARLNMNPSAIFILMLTKQI